MITRARLPVGWAAFANRDRHSMTATKTKSAGFALGVLLLGSTAIAVGQPAPTPPAPPAQTTQNPTVAAAEATHIAMLTTGDAAAATPAGTAWLFLDTQNNAIRWTIELTGITATDAYIQCTEADAAAGAAPGAPAAPAAPAAPPAAPPAVGEPAPAGAAAEAEGDLNLAGGDTMNPIQGDAAGIEPDLLGRIAEGECAIVVETDAAEARGEIVAATVDAGAPAAPPAAGQAPAAPATPAPGAPAPAAPGPAAAAPPDDPALLAALVQEGGPIYRSNCVPCHGQQAEGGAGPALAGDQFLASATAVANQIVNGGAYMPPFGQLSNRQVAAVGTFIRNSFGNSFGIVTEAQVATTR
jgi:mono/diheme cytochrome c family protein